MIQTFDLRYHTDYHLVIFFELVCQYYVFLRHVPRVGAAVSLFPQISNAYLTPYPVLKTKLKSELKISSKFFCDYKRETSKCD